MNRASFIESITPFADKPQQTTILVHILSERGKQLHGIRVLVNLINFKGVKINYTVGPRYVAPFSFKSSKELHL